MRVRLLFAKLRSCCVGFSQSASSSSSFVKRIARFRRRHRLRGALSRFEAVPCRGFEERRKKSEVRRDERHRTKERRKPKTIYLKDYQTPAYEFEQVNLSFQLNEDETTVSSSIDVRVQRKNETLFLHGDKSMQLDAVLVNGTQVADERLTRSNAGLFVSGLPEEDFTLEIVTTIKPQENTALEGLYKSSGNYCTQCEAEGFRSNYVLPRQTGRDE